ncbi:hypothetical protein WBJ53_26145 [Spirosoma sp. SC4-14]|uniref:hypothetical protein n=1 Tax=Spirosoma sp. SC4-14 TaxID=3128900 RepID=UPI0030CB38EA
MRTYISINNLGESVTGWPTNNLRYYLRANGGTCDDDEAAFHAAVAAINATAGVNYAQKMNAIIGITLAAAPAAQAGYQWVIRDCGAVEEEVIAVADNIDRSGGTNPTDPGASDPQSESDVQIFTSQSGSDGGTVTQ